MYYVCKMLLMLVHSNPQWAVTTWLRNPLPLLVTVISIMLSNLHGLRALINARFCATFNTVYLHVDGVGRISYGK